MLCVVQMGSLLRRLTAVKITCSAGSAPSDPLDPVLERCCKSIAVFFQLPFCGSSGGLCGCGAGLGGFGGAISDVVLSGLGNCKRQKASHEHKGLFTPLKAKLLL